MDKAVVVSYNEWGVSEVIDPSVLASIRGAALEGHIENVSTRTENTVCAINLACPGVNTCITDIGCIGLAE